MHHKTAKKMISSSEVLYFTDGISQGIRADGRSCDAIRPMSVDLGVVASANGSCRVRSRGTDLYIAIKCDIGRPTSSKPREGIVNVSVEFGCSVLPRLQDFTGRQATLEADAFAEIVSSHVVALCLSGLNREQFCIEPGRACWIVSVDVLVEAIDGPILDPISLGVRAAFMDLELPIVAVTPDGETRDGNDKMPVVPRVELTGDVWNPSSSGLPAICVSVGVFCENSVMLVDLDRIEENLAKSKGNNLITISVNESGDCCGIHKFGSGALDPMAFRDVVSSGSVVGKGIATLINSLVNQRN